MFPPIPKANHWAFSFFPFFFFTKSIGDSILIVCLNQNLISHNQSIRLKLLSLCLPLFHSPLLPSLPPFIFLTQTLATLQLRLMSRLPSSCLSLLTAWIAGMYHSTWLVSGFVYAQSFDGPFFLLEFGLPVVCQDSWRVS